MSAPDPKVTNPTGRVEAPGGMFERTIARWLMRPARIAEVAVLSEHFRFIGFEGEALQQAPWVPGDKIQVKLDGGLLTRTYTPIRWNAVRGTTRILAYSHTDGPGSQWARTCTPGDERFLFGPRRSLEVGDSPRPPVVFGDETSFGLVHALQSHVKQLAAHAVFEVSSARESAELVNGIGLQAHLIERQADETHLAEVVRELERFIEGDTVFVLTGKSTSIQVLSRALKESGVPPRRLRAKAYWSPGKRGLD